MSESGDRIRKSAIELQRIVDKHKQGISVAKVELDALRQKALEYNDLEREQNKVLEETKRNATLITQSISHQQQIIGKLEAEVSNLMRQVSALQSQAIEADKYVQPAEQI